MFWQCNDTDTEVMALVKPLTPWKHFVFHYILFNLLFYSPFLISSSLDFPLLFFVIFSALLFLFFYLSFTPSRFLCSTSALFSCPLLSSFLFPYVYFILSFPFPSFPFLFFHFSTLSLLLLSSLSSFPYWLPIFSLLPYFFLSTPLLSPFFSVKLN